METDESETGTDRTQRYCAVHRRCAEEWARWSTDGTTPASFEPVIEPESGPRARAADLVLRFGLYRCFGQNPGGAPDRAEPDQMGGPDAR